MKKLFLIVTFVPLFLISCGKTEEIKTIVTPLVVESSVVITGSIVESNTGKVEEVSTGMFSETGTEENHGIPSDDNEIIILKLNQEDKNGSFHEKNIDIDFGRYGYTILSGSTDIITFLGKFGYTFFSGSTNTGIVFGPYKLAGEPIITGITQSYSFIKIPHKSKNEMIQEITKNTFDGINGAKLKESLKFNGLEIIVWEEFGGYPTYSQNFVVIGKYDNYFFGTDDLLHMGFDTEEEKKIDYDFILSVIKSLKIQ